MLTIAANPDCENCQGSGEVFDWVPYRSTHVPMPSICDCVMDQVPEDWVDEEIDVLPCCRPIAVVVETHFLSHGFHH